MIKQGHKYSYQGTQPVIAMESSKEEFVQVQFIESDVVGHKLGQKGFVNVCHLKPLPMKYFHGEVPK